MIEGRLRNFWVHMGENWKFSVQKSLGPVIFPLKKEVVFSFAIKTSANDVNIGFIHGLTIRSI